ncbi:MAG: hydroxymethylbilane synthase [Saprospiraceae bacterium]
MRKEIVRIGSRGSKLALWQANFFQSLLVNKGIESEIKIIKTKGDLIQNVGFDKLEGKGFFTKEIEDALITNSVDVAIHSMKDLPTTQPSGLVIGGISERANPADILIIQNKSIDLSNPLKIKSNGKIGTSSIRRKVLLRNFQQDVFFKDIRGNVPTRILKLENDAELDAIVLAAAGVERLGIDLSAHMVIELDPTEFPSAPAQGVLAYQCRKDDLKMRRLLKTMHCTHLLPSINVERKVLKLMDGGCQVPLGVYCYRDIALNYHCHAAFSNGADVPLLSVKISQSTVSNLAERVATKLKMTT